MPEDIIKKIETALPEKPGAAPEKEISPEALAERRFEAAPSHPEEIKPAERTGEAVRPAPAPAKTLQQIREEQIDEILADGLEEAFLKMAPKQQMAFKAEGERTAKKINQLLNKARISLKKIVDLIRRWLLLVPGVNKFFLEQEAKIKADRIVKLKR